MSATPAALPVSRQHPMSFPGGPAIGISNRWERGQYCAILTRAGIVGCGVYGMEVPAEFGQAIAIARGTPAAPLVEPEDLLTAKIVNCTPQARKYGIEPGMTGREAVDRLLAAFPAKAPEAGGPAPPIRVRQIDHVTFVVGNLDNSRAFYRGVLGMDEVPRPNFSFPGLWFQAGSTQIHLILEHPEAGPSRVTLADGLAVSRTRHVAFEVDDAAATVRRLGELGIPIASGPKQRPDGPTQLYIFDPDGNLIELFAMR